MRHQWGKPDRVQFKTERQCARCGLVKVGHRQHEGGRDRNWTEFWRGLELVGRDKTPACFEVAV